MSRKLIPVDRLTVEAWLNKASELRGWPAHLSNDECKIRTFMRHWFDLLPTMGEQQFVEGFKAALRSTKFFPDLSEVIACAPDVPFPGDFVVEPDSDEKPVVSCPPNVKRMLAEIEEEMRA